MDVKVKSGPEYQGTEKECNYEMDFAGCRMSSHQLLKQILDSEGLNLAVDKDLRRLQIDLPMAATCMLLEGYADYISDESSASSAQSDVPSPDEALEEDWAMKFLDEIKEHYNKFLADFKFSLCNKGSENSTVRNEIVRILSYTATILSISMYFDHLPRFEYDVPLEKEKTFAEDLKRRLEKVEQERHDSRSGRAVKALASNNQTPSDLSAGFDPELY